MKKHNQELKNLEKIIKPIIEGHTKAFVTKIHPIWFPKKLRNQIIKSLSKRIVNDICCDLNLKRIKASIECTELDSSDETREISSEGRMLIQSSP